MNKKIIIILIIILGVVAVSGCIGNDELTINNVAGVNDIKLPSENFTSSNIEGGEDAYHSPNGDMVVIYAPTNNGIRFSNISDNYNETSFFSDSGYVYNDSYSTVNPITIAGIKGYHSHDIDLGDAFFFIMNNKVYMISIDDGSLTDNLLGVEIILEAWLKASGYHQTWSYPETITKSVADSNNKSDWDSSTGKGTPTYEEMKSDANAKGDYDFSYEDYKENMKNWDPTEEHIG